LSWGKLLAPSSDISRCLSIFSLCLLFSSLSLSYPIVSLDPVCLYIRFCPEIPYKARFMRISAIFSVCHP
jgi:hypothetical protein